ncbi:MAG: pitrilysin family protein [Candidatus Kapaibacterium sp.]|jgi:zinc protease
MMDHSAELERVAIIPFVEYNLDNGLHVVLAESHSSPIVAVNLWYHVGSKDEDPTRTGFAHLFEHMMFQGSDNIKKTEHFKYVQSAGGNLNATTSQDRTNYFEILPSTQLELALWLESDRMLALAVTEENFENQRAVVTEERRQRYDNQPYGLVYEALLERVFTTSGYHWSTIGSMQQLAESTLPEIRAFHTKFYQPNNASLALVGDFQPEQARPLIEKYFGSIVSGGEIVRKAQHIEPIAGQIRHTMYDQVPLPAVYLAFQGSRAFSRSEQILDIVSRILASGRSSRMYTSLVYQNKIAKEVSTFNIAGELTGMLGISSTVQIGVDPAIVEAALWHEIELLLEEGITETELQKAKNKLEASHVRSLMHLSSRADQLQQAYTYTGRTERANEIMEELLSLTLEEVLEGARAILRKDACVVIHVLPKTESAGATEAT